MVTLDSAPLAATVVNYVTSSSGTADGDDFDSVAGALTFAIGQTSATVAVTVNGDTTYESDETVAITFSGAKLVASVTATGTIANNDVEAVVTGEAFLLTTGIDKGTDFTGGTGDDTFTGNTTAGVVSFTSLDALDGGLGDDTLDITVTAALDTTAAVSATVTAIETAVLTSSSTIIADTTDWTGLTTLTATATGASAAITAASTTDVTLGVTGTADAEYTVDAGNSVTTSTSTTIDIEGGNSAGSTVIGATTAAAGAVSVSHTEKATDPKAAAGADAASGSVITVTGGTSITVSSLATVGTGDNAGDILTLGAVTITGDTNTTTVSVTQAAATAVWAAAGDKISIDNGAVTITDGNAITAADTITTVTLNNYDDSTVTSTVLSSVTLKGGSALASGTLTLDQSAADTSTAATTLGLNLTSGLVGAIDGTQADAYTTVNIVAAAAATIADVSFAAATALNFSGAGITTLTVNTGIAAVEAITSTGGGVTLGTALDNSVAFTGGAGVETIIVGATTQAISLGAGDDDITVSASALGTDGSVDGGDGNDTLTMTAANAITASADEEFEATISNMEKLSVAAVAATGTVDLANLDDINDVTIAGVAVGQVLTLDNAATGVNISFADATQTAVTVTLATSGSADVANLFLSHDDGGGTTVTTATLTGFETVAITTADEQDTPDGAEHTITTLTNANAKTITVTGNAGLTIGTFTGTALTSFDASGVTLGGVSYTTDALAGASTLTGGAGADTLNAAAAVKTVNLVGNAGIDTLTGSATKSSTISGGAGNDVITGGAAADSIDGGAGTADSFTFSSATVVEQAGSGTTTGAVINLSSAAITGGDVFTASGAFLTTSVTSIAAGSATYLYDTESTTNASIVDTISNIEIVIGTNLADYIIGSSSANSISGGLGIDTMTGGSGADTFVFASSTTGTPSATVFDEITDYTLGADIIDFGATALISVTSGSVAAAATGLITAGFATFNAADNELAEKLIAVNAGLLAGTEATGQVAVFTHDDDTYLYIYDNTADTIDTADVFIKLTGVTATSAAIVGGNLVIS